MITEIINTILDHPNIKRITDAIADNIKTKVIKDGWQVIYKKSEKYKDREYFSISYFCAEYGVAVLHTGERTYTMVAKDKDKEFHFSYTNYFPGIWYQYLSEMDDNIGMAVEWATDVHKTSFKTFKDYVDKQEEQNDE